MAKLKALSKNPKFKCAKCGWEAICGGTKPGQYGHFSFVMWNCNCNAEIVPIKKRKPKTKG